MVIASNVQTVCRVSQVHPTLDGLSYVMAGNLTHSKDFEIAASHVLKVCYDCIITADTQVPPKEDSQNEMEKFRVIVLYDAANDAEAAKKADSAAKATGGKVDRLTKRAETWGAVEVPPPGPNT